MLKTSKSGTRTYLLYVLLFIAFGFILVATGIIPKSKADHLKGDSRIPSESSHGNSRNVDNFARDSIKDDATQKTLKITKLEQGLHTAVTDASRAITNTKKLEEKVERLESLVQALSAPTKMTTKELPTESFCGENDACNGRGTCMISRCFCDPGATGSTCSEGSLHQCENIAGLAERLTCWRNPTWGTSKVDVSTWKAALRSELGVWRGMGVGSNDHSDVIKRGFSNYATFLRGSNLGNYAELGCGPFTQTLTSLLSARPDLTFTNITLTDPNLANYVRDVPGAPYITGMLRLSAGSPPPNAWGPVHLITAGAEEPIFNGELDTVLMTNVLEHVQNAYAVLHQLHRALRPGGIVMFSEHWWDDFSYFEQVEENNKLHPVRIRKQLVDFFLSHFEKMYEHIEDRIRQEEGGVRYTGISFIGRKK